MRVAVTISEYCAAYLGELRELKMKTYDELILTFQKDLFELGKLEEQPWMADKHALRLKEIGRHCYEAEETLNTADLKLLKRRLGMSESNWRSYKSRFIHHPPEKD